MFVRRVAEIGGVNLFGDRIPRIGGEKGCELEQRVVENFPVFLLNPFKRNRKQA